MITLSKDRYEPLGHLGSGATSRVEKARDTVIGRTVALKTFLNSFGKGIEEQFLREAQTIGRLSHGSIAQLYDVSTDTGGTAFLVMEFVSGENLEQMLAQSPIPIASAAVWGANLASALAYAHRAGIIHGDIKPSNIRVTENDQVKLVDFGVARFASQVSGSDRVLGTPAYLSPEQIEGQKQDGRSDLFSLGVVLYEMLTGVRPFAGNSLGEVCAEILTADPIPPSKRNPAVPAAFDRIIARCLAKNPEERYQSGNDLARALFLVARAGDKLSVQPKRPYWFMRPAHPRDLLAIASAVLLLAGAVSAADSLRDWIRTQSTPAIASVGPNSSKDAGLATHALNPSNPQSPATTESVPQKPVGKSSTQKRSSTNSVPQAREDSPLDPLLERSPLR